eukprot:scaffold42473_cov39-Phaeocystis_antarctica.AAC.1
MSEKPGYSAERCCSAGTRNPKNPRHYGPSRHCTSQPSSAGPAVRAVRTAGTATAETAAATAAAAVSAAGTAVM